MIITNTGAPQGTVLTPFSFFAIIHPTAEHNNCFLDKYADDTVLTGMILNDNFINYTQEVMSFVDWCDSNHLVLNVTKIKEMVIDFRKQTKVPDLIVIKEKDVERVETFKYLGIVLDNKLTWKQNTDSIVKKKNKTSSTLLEEVANFQCSQYATPIILYLYCKYHTDFWTDLLGRQHRKS